jgi:hypothetical protein
VDIGGAGCQELLEVTHAVTGTPSAYRAARSKRRVAWDREKKGAAMNVAWIKKRKEPP